uniref:Uncharacterized protein n=1 Tax=Myotis lucifugus TaxID=59463 RepID=G1Q277_MYOLU
ACPKQGLCSPSLRPALPSSSRGSLLLLLLVPAPLGLLQGLSHSLVVWASRPSSCPQSTHLYNQH